MVLKLSVPVVLKRVDSQFLKNGRNARLLRGRLTGISSRNELDVVLVDGAGWYFRRARDRLASRDSLNDSKKAGWAEGSILG